MKPTVYVETTIPSYYVSRPSRDVIVLAHQEVTCLWWEERLPTFDAYISPVVLEEAGRGNAAQAAKRLKALAPFAILEATTDVETLASQYMENLGLPAKAIRDAAHLAFACLYDLDFLVTWNCSHIANAQIVRHLTSINAAAGLPMPTTCTPEELMGTEVEDDD